MGYFSIIVTTLFNHCLHLSLPRTDIMLFSHDNFILPETNTIIQCRKMSCLAFLSPPIQNTILSPLRLSHGSDRGAYPIILGYRAVADMMDGITPSLIDHVTRFFGTQGIRSRTVEIHHQAPCPLQGWVCS